MISFACFPRLTARTSTQVSGSPCRNLAAEREKGSQERPDVWYWSVGPTLESGRSQPTIHLSRARSDVKKRF